MIKNLEDYKTSFAKYRTSDYPQCTAFKQVMQIDVCMCICVWGAGGEGEAGKNWMLTFLLLALLN